MVEEMGALIENDMWQLVPLPNEIKRLFAITIKQKTDSSVKPYGNIVGIHSDQLDLPPGNFAPVATMKSIWVIFHVQQIWLE